MGDGLGGLLVVEVVVVGMVVVEVVVVGMVVVEVVAIVHHLQLVVVDKVVATVHQLPLVEVDSLESLLGNHLLQVDIVHLLHPMGTDESFDKR